MARGGARPGAGRPLATITRAKQAHASQLLKKLGGDETWLWALKQAREANDYEAVADIMEYWTDRAEGKATQAHEHSGKDGDPLKILVEHIGTPNQTAA